MLIEKYRIEVEPLWIKVDCAFLPNEALITILDFIPGVIWVGIKDNYTLRIAFEENTNKEKVTRSVISKLNQFLEEI